MILVIEFLAGFIEPLLFFLGAIVSYIFGNAFYRAINTFLYSLAAPCIEVISLIIAVIAPVAYYYGVSHKKFFFNRTGRHNFFIFLWSYLFGAIVTLLPLSYSYVSDSVILYCRAQNNITDSIFQFISTGFIASFIAFISLDLGVIYANIISGRLKKMREEKK